MKPKTQARKARKKTVCAPTESLANQTFNMYVEAAVQDWASELPPTFTREQYATFLDTYVHLAFQKVSVRFHYKEKCIRTSMPAAVVVANFKRYDDTELWTQEEFNRTVLPLMTETDLQSIGDKMGNLRKRANELHLSSRETEHIIRANITRLRPDKRPKKVQRGEVLIRLVQELEHIKESVHDSKQINSFEELSKQFPTFLLVRIMRTQKFK